MESYLTRYARLSAGTMSLIATTSISLPRRPWSQIARKTSRPMRPKPLMPILVIIFASLVGGVWLRITHCFYPGLFVLSEIVRYGGRSCAAQFANCCPFLVQLCLASSVGGEKCFHVSIFRLPPLTF